MYVLPYKGAGVLHNFIVWQTHILFPIASACGFDVILRRSSLNFWRKFFFCPTPHSTSIHVLRYKGAGVLHDFIVWQTHILFPIASACGVDVIFRLSSLNFWRKFFFCPTPHSSSIYVLPYKGAGVLHNFLVWQTHILFPIASACGFDVILRRSSLNFWRKFFFCPTPHSTSIHVLRYKGAGVLHDFIVWQTHILFPIASACGVDVIFRLSSLNFWRKFFFCPTPHSSSIYVLPYKGAGVLHNFLVWQTHILFPIASACGFDVILRRSSLNFWRKFFFCPTP